MLLGYNTNGFVHHRLSDALLVLAELGYVSAAITLERELLDPPDLSGVSAGVKRLREALRSSGLRCTIETGARFLLDPRRKHQPTLLSPGVEDRRRREGFLAAAVEMAAAVNADSVSIWSGTPESEEPAEALLDRLCEALAPVLDRAARLGVRVAFEPEPGMFIERMEHFTRLFERLSHPALGLTLDVGHVHCLADGTVAAHARRWAGVLWNVHLDDARLGVHDHLMFGEGQIDFATVLRDFRESGYSGPLHVELSRHSHDAVQVARRSFEFLSRMAAT